MYRLPVIIDVDTGLDDAMVLAMACALPELDVLVSTENRDPYTYL